MKIMKMKIKAIINFNINKLFLNGNIIKSAI